MPPAPLANGLRRDSWDGRQPGGRPQRKRRRLALALLATGAMWLLLTGVYMGSLLRSTVGRLSHEHLHS